MKQYSISLKHIIFMESMYKYIYKCIFSSKLTIGPKNKAMVTLYNYFVQKIEERGKTAWGKFPSRKDKAQYEQHVFIIFFPHLDDLV